MVNKIKHITKEKVGHLGTLDPLATGVLPIAVGKATRFFDYFLNKEKKYYALARFGVETNTLDSEGKIIATSNNVKFSVEDVYNAAQKLVGEKLQMPPIFSAKSVGGVRAYDAALKNQEIQLEPKLVNVYSIDVKPWVKEGIYEFYIHCSSGTYVRSIIRDVAEILNSKATTVVIIRTKSGAFEIENAVTIEEFESNAEKYLLPINNVLNMKTLNISLNQARDLFSGKEIQYDCEDGEYLTFFEGVEFSVVECVGGKIKNKIYLYKEEKV